MSNIWHIVAPQNMEEKPQYDDKHHVIIPFAADLLPDKKDQEAILSYRGGIQATIWMVEFIQGMLDSKWKVQSSLLDDQYFSWVSRVFQERYTEA